MKWVWFLIIPLILFPIVLVHFNNLMPSIAQVNSTVMDNTTTHPPALTIPTQIPDKSVENKQVTLIRTIFPSEWEIPHPAGLSYSLDHDHLALLTKSDPTQPTAVNSAVAIITPFEDLVATMTLPFVTDNAINIAYDDDRDQLLLLNNEQNELAQVVVGADGILDPNSLTRFDINHLALNYADGMDVDLGSQRLFILDSGTAQAVSVETTNNYQLISKIDLCHLDAPYLRGIAIHPISHNLFIMSPSAKILFELTDTGQLLNTYDLATLNLVDPRGLTFGPSSDLTDDLDTIHLYMADSSLPDGDLQLPGDYKLFIPFVVQSTGDGSCVSYSHPAPVETEQEFGRILEVALSTTVLPPTNTVRFAVIGDFGDNNSNEARVATLVDGWNPDFVITTGDNNYPDGEAATIDDTIGQYYSQFIGNYQGTYGVGSPNNRFWPTLGNHDWHTISCNANNCTGAYFDYFTLPNNERYYEVDLGIVHLFALDSDKDEPDGRKQNSVQADWLFNQLTASTSCYNIVYFHHAPYSSGRHGSNTAMRWPFSTWGADVVLSGHDHVYERLDVSGTPYFVNGVGGASLYDFSNLGSLPPEATSIVRYNQDYGAILVTAASTGITYQFYNADNILIDTYTMPKSCE